MSRCITYVDRKYLQYVFVSSDEIANKCDELMEKNMFPIMVDDISLAEQTEYKIIKAEERCQDCAYLVEGDNGEWQCSNCYYEDDICNILKVKECSIGKIDNIEIE